MSEEVAVGHDLPVGIVELEDREPLHDNMISQTRHNMDKYP